MAQSESIIHTCFIYVLYSREGVIDYVGRSRNVKRRIQEHAFRLGFKPHYEIVHQCSTDCRNVEREWIGKYRDSGFKLRNISYGQGPHFAGPETRAKISKANKGKKLSPETIARMSKAQKGLVKDYSEDGEKRRAVNQFKSGVNSFELLSEDGKRRKIEAARKNWEGISVEERTRRAVERNSAMWGKKSTEERAQVGRNILAGRLAKRSLEVIQAEARANGKIAAIRLAAMDPKARAELIRSRAEKSKISKAANRAARIAAQQSPLFPEFGGTINQSDNLPSGSL